jgi:hypothetical protein
MADPIMVNSKDNQACFNCASFQPYNADDPVEYLDGECRWCPKVGRLRYVEDYWNQYWPYIANGQKFWCSKWKLTAQTPIVPVEFPRVSEFPDDFNTFHAAPWNRRASLNQSCWSCNHYQYTYDPPVEPGQNTGECRKLAPPPVVSYGITPTTGVFESVKFVYVGSSYFCSAWEINRGTVPPDPGPIQE